MENPLNFPNQTSFFFLKRKYHIALSSFSFYKPYLLLVEEKEDWKRSVIHFMTCSSCNLPAYSCNNKTCTFLSLNIILSTYFLSGTLHLALILQEKPIYITWYLHTYAYFQTSKGLFSYKPLRLNFFMEKKMHSSFFRKCVM